MGFSSINGARLPTKLHGDERTAEVQPLEVLARLQLVIDVAPRRQHLAPLESVAATSHQLRGEFRLTRAQIQVIERKPFTIGAEADSAFDARDRVPIGRGRLAG